MKKQSNLDSLMTKCICCGERFFPSTGHQIRCSNCQSKNRATCNHADGRRPMSSHLEDQFATLLRWGRVKMPYMKEHRFAPPRRFRFDFAWPEQKIAVEIEGGLYGKGRHTTINGFNNDCEKYNLAVVMGWRVLRFTERMLTDDPTATIATLRQLFVKEER